MIRTLIEREPAERWHLTWPRCTIRRYRGAERSTPTEVDARWATRLARSKPGPGRVATGLAVRIDRAHVGTRRRDLVAQLPRPPPRPRLGPREDHP
jgi:hypothetical protein